MHLIPADPLVTERVRNRIAQRLSWSLSTGLSCRIPPEADVVLLPAERCGECLLETRPSPAYVAYGAAQLLPGCVLRGCADFLKTPWEGNELEFRLERFARPLAFSVGGMEVRLEHDRLVSAAGRTGITAAERTVLELLIRRAGEPVSREALFYALWGTDGGSSRLVDVYVSRLRLRLREVLPAGGAADPLRAVYGHGYSLET